MHQKWGHNLLKTGGGGFKGPEKGGGSRGAKKGGLKGAKKRGGPEFTVVSE